MRHKPVILLIRKPWAIGLVMAALLLFLGGAFSLIGVFAPGIKDKVIVIDPGHGGKDPGAQFGGLKEKDINLDVALRLRQILEAKGCKVIMTREIDKDYFAPGMVGGRMAKRVELNKRIGIASANQADLFISIHTNSFSRTSYGAETYYHFKSTAGKALAERIQKELSVIQPDNKRTAKAGDYYLINQTKMPSVLVEIGFMSNSRERKLLVNDSYKNSVAAAIGQGIETYFRDFPYGVQDSAPALSNLEAGPAQAVENSFKLYFPTANLENLVPEDRQEIRSVWNTLNPAQKISHILSELIKGPKASSEIPPLPPATEVLGVNIQNGIATVNFNNRIRDDFTGGVLEEELAVKSIVWSTAQVPGIQGVRILVNGQFGDSIGGHILLDHTLTPVPKVARAAIIIDDFGINNPGTAEMFNLGIPITAAVMPNMQFSRQEAEILHQKGYEIILHMPMEAKNGRPDWLGPGALFSNLDSSEIRSRLIQALSSVPYCVGISNHMGSQGTESIKIIREMINLAKERSLIIMDSKTSEKTILAKEAKNAGLPYGIRDVFLDNSADLLSIKKQIKTLIETAKKNGKAIGIGHVGPQGPNTARAIREMLPEFEKAGIQLVPLSELAED